MILSGLVKDSFIDYEGYHSLVVFTKGCNLACPKCFNRFQMNETLGEFKEVVLANWTPIHEALVIVGGEPTIWPDLIDCIKWVKKTLGFKIKVKLFTNGMNLTRLMQLDAKNLLDAISIDVKCISSSEVTGVEFKEEDSYFLKVCKAIDIFYCNIGYLELRTPKWVSDKELENIEAYVKKRYPKALHIIQEDLNEIYKES